VLVAFEVEFELPVVVAIMTVGFDDVEVVPAAVETPEVDDATDDILVVEPVELLVDVVELALA